MSVDVAPDPLLRVTDRLAAPPDPIRADDLSAAAASYRDFRRESPAGDVDDWTRRLPIDCGAAEFFKALHQNSPDSALQLATAAIRLPSAGDEVAGFRLVRELGRGAFGRVFLAEQLDLDRRPVVLKVTLDARTEVKALARLLHTNIVPVYSVHRAGLYQAVCMPFCGSTTLADAVRRFRGETLPESGKGLVTLLQSSAGPNSVPAGEPGGSAPGTDPPAAHQPSSNAVLNLLGGLSYTDAILWLGARLADGLAHAHDRGILHRDLKPANVLLTDDGQPMLLDFNLAADAALDGLAEAARLGGTLPYMAPEHLESFAGRKRVVDARSDVYALGVILFELLTGRHPFPVYRRTTTEVLRQMVEDRRAVPRLRAWNPAVSAAVESVVRTCLQQDPADRYPSAQALQEDLERQLRHQPLKHAADPSPAERLGKWARRHPRLSSWFTLGTAAAVLLGLAAGTALYERDRRLGLEAREARAAFLDDSRRFQLAVTLFEDDDRQALRDAARKGQLAVGRYPSPDDPAWGQSPAVRHLPAADRAELRQEIGVALLMLAHATARGAGDREAVEAALRINRRAESCFPPNAIPAAVREQRAQLLKQLHRDPEDVQAAAPSATARGLYLDGWNLARQGKFAAAIPLLEQATRMDSRAVWAWFLLGHCHDVLGHDPEAIGCYGTCLALAPDAPEAWFNRGLAHLRRAEFEKARNDLDRAVELKDDVAEAYFNRALARKELGNLAGAEADLTRTLELNADATRAYFVRAQVRDRLNKRDEAAADRKAGLSREPADESSWTARGYHRMTARPADPTGAIADFDAALTRNPQYLPALRNKAEALAELLGKPAEAAAVLDQALTHYPDNALFRASRAVYLARAGQRADAHGEAEAALRLRNDPATRYQVAGVYALTSKSHPEDRREAFRLLSSALQAGYGFQYLDIDPELDPVRPLPEFQELVSAARALRKK
jgi:serine/threonine protein kinase/Flp pilus assembly protein TadD